MAEALGNATTTQAAKVTTEAEWQAEALLVKQAEAFFVKAASVPTEVKFDRGIPTARAVEAYSVYTSQAVVVAQAVVAQADASQAAVATAADEVFLADLSVEGVPLVATQRARVDGVSPCARQALAEVLNVDGVALRAPISSSVGQVAAAQADAPDDATQADATVDR